MKIKDILKKSVQILNENNIDESILKSRILLACVLEVNKEYLIINDDKEISEKQEKNFFDGISRLTKGEPIQYITNSQKFMNLKFYVDKRVLIPQPDTEILVENVISVAKNMQKNCQNELKILDLCTGSGVIGICLYNSLQNVKIYASDISDDALEVAKKNNDLNNTKVNFIKSDLFENINEKFDIIVSNPPYIETEVIDNLSKEVQNEPKLALDGGKDGLDFYRKIIKQSPDFLNKNGYLALEIGYNQKDSVEKLLKSNNYKDIIIKKDLSNLDRVIIGEIHS